MAYQQLIARSLVESFRLQSMFLRMAFMVTMDSAQNMAEQIRGGKGEEMMIWF